MTRALIVLLLALLAPAFAADAPVPGDRARSYEPPKGYALISMADVARIGELLQAMTDALTEQDQEIARLKRLAARGGCT